MKIMQKLGDIVVFKQGNTAFGHVGFFKSQTDDTVTILGGNQDNKVSTKEFRKNGTLYQLIAYRRP